MIELFLVIVSFIAGFFLGVKKRSTEKMTWQQFVERLNK
jgi:hypothetical protein